jgi:hypothetical protein
MADFTVKDWMEEESAAQRETIALDMAGSMYCTYKDLF